MKINYKILNADKTNHSIVVRYWTENLNEDDLAIEFNPNGSIKLNEFDNSPIRCSTDYNITLYEYHDPSEEDIKTVIMDHAPIKWLQLKEEMKLNKNSKNLKSANKLINKEDSFEVRLQDK